MINDKEKIIQNLIEIVKKTVRNNKVNRDSSTKNLPQWDSLAYMAIISEVELLYDLTVTQDNIEKFDSIQSIADLIKNK
jgi:acyl carrier protein